MLLRVIDFETTGMPPDARLCEIGWCDVFVDGDIADVSTPISMLVKPGIPMPPEARAVHHISDADLADAPPIDAGRLALAKGNPDVFVAHNAAFEREFYTGSGKPWICTMKAARRLWPECPNHTNQCLRYWLGITLDERIAMPPHRAGPDAYVTAFILARMLDRASVSDLVEWTSEPSLLPRVTFGKHRGKEWADVPRDYLEWIAYKSDLDADAKFTAKHHLAAREAF